MRGKTPPTPDRDRRLAQRYQAAGSWRALTPVILLACVVLLALYALAMGSYDLSPLGVLKVLLGGGEPAQRVVIWNLRLPRICAALATGWALGLAGLADQTLLRNPLASPFTLGVSHGAALGAAMAIVLLGAGTQGVGVHTDTARTQFLFSHLYLTTAMALAGALCATLVILLLAWLRKLEPSTIILAGVALASLFLAGTTMLQYFASETELAAVIFWTFGDVARSSWREIGLLTLVTAGVSLYFRAQRWNLNALLAGDEAALGLGVEVTRLRLIGMLLSTLLAALATAFHGVIAFLGLLAPHIGRRLVGHDHRRLVLVTCLTGALLLLLADTLGRLLLVSGSLPVGVLTSFMGAPLFLYLLLRERRP